MSNMSEKEPHTGVPVELFPGERLIDIIEVVEDEPSRLPSSLREVERLTRVKSSREIGENGPSLASLGLSEQESDGKEHHLFEVVFGRDSLRVAEDLLAIYPKLASSTLLRLAELQGASYYSSREEEPGRIIHEDRDPLTDPIARDLTRSRGWGWPYYGSIDSTPHFVKLFYAYCNQSPTGYKFLDEHYQGRDGQTHSMADAFKAAVGWIENRIDQNREGLLEFKPKFIGSIENQAWRDAWDAYFHADGTLANHHAGIASVEVQGMTYDALLAAADVFETKFGEYKRASDLRWKAQWLKRTVVERFWVDERGGYFALGTDRDENGSLRQLKIKTSNMGHLLKSGLLNGSTPLAIEQRQRVVSQLFGSDMVGLNGIRTLSSEEVRYRPGAYQNGSVWIWDNYKIAQGLAQHGYNRLAGFIYDKLLDDINATRRFPEYLRGDNDPEQRLNTRIVDVYDIDNGRRNRVEQPPQDIQAWSAAAILAIKFSRGRRNRDSSRVSMLLEHKLLRALN